MPDPTDLIQELWAALSWQLAPRAANPAYQAHLELQQAADPAYHINPLGVHHPDYVHLFTNQPEDTHGNR